MNKNISLLAILLFAHVPLAEASLTFCDDAEFIREVNRVDAIISGKLVTRKEFVEPIEDIWTVAIDTVYKGDLEEGQHIDALLSRWMKGNVSEDFFIMLDKTQGENYSYERSPHCLSFSRSLQSEPLTVADRAALGVAETPRFPDVPTSNIFYDAIEYVYNEDIVQGYPNGTFQPDSTINRAEFAKIASLFYWDGESQYVDMCNSVHFDDVPRGTWFFHYVCSAKDHEIVQGYPGTRIYAPERSISVAEAAKMIIKASKIQHETGEPWYAPYIQILKDRHALPNSLPSLDQPITRGQVAEIFYRLSKETEEPILLNQTFNSSYFTFSFEVPEGFEVIDTQNRVAIAKSPFYTRAIGDDNAFFSMVRYNEYNSKQSQMTLYRRILKNLEETSITIDGLSFPMWTADDYGRFEGDSAGRVTLVFFDASLLEIIERPANEIQEFDPVALGRKILSTARFSKE